MRNVILSLMLLALLAITPGQAQQGYGGAPAGSEGASALPVFQAGKYMLTNVATGRVSYIYVAENGEVFLKGDPAVQPSLAPACPQSKYGCVRQLLGQQATAYQPYSQPAYAQRPSYGAVPAGYPQQAQAGYPQQAPAGYPQQAPAGYPQQPAYGQLPQGYPQQASPVFGTPGQGYGR